MKHVKILFGFLKYLVEECGSDLGKCELSLFDIPPDHSRRASYVSEIQEKTRELNVIKKVVFALDDALKNVDTKGWGKQFNGKEIPWNEIEKSLGIPGLTPKKGTLKAALKDVQFSDEILKAMALDVITIYRAELKRGKCNPERARVLRERIADAEKELKKFK